MLVVPHGFTLCVAGVLTSTVGQRGFPGLMPVWLFVVGAGLTFAFVLLATDGHRQLPPPSPAAVGGAVFNLTPIGVVPGACLASWWIASNDLAFLVAGVVTVALYLAALTGLILMTNRRP